METVTQAQIDFLIKLETERPETVAANTYQILFPDDVRAETKNGASARIDWLKTGGTINIGRHMPAHYNHLLALAPAVIEYLERENEGEPESYFAADLTPAQALASEVAAIEAQDRRWQRAASGALSTIRRAVDQPDAILQAAIDQVKGA